MAFEVAMAGDMVIVVSWVIPGKDNNKRNKIFMNDFIQAI
jgi:hypothetical protein